MATVDAGWRGAGFARVAHALTATVVWAALVLQTMLVVQRGSGPMVSRLVDLASYFTVQSNVLVALAATSLALSPARDGRVWRVLRLAALLGITVTGVVYVTVLAPLHDLSGAPAVADAGLHYASPLLAVGAWFAYGPRPRVDRRTLVWSVAWPVAYFGWTLAHGAATGWYPYPFVDVEVIGYPAALRNAVLVTALLAAVAWSYSRGDEHLRPAPVGGDAARTVTGMAGMVDVTGRWEVDAIDAAPVRGPELELAADGRVTGTTGVNRLAGTYEVVDGHLRLGPTATTRMAGPEDAMKVESRLLALLDGPLHPAADDAGLLLTGADGSLHLVRAGD